jgi:hypothetical protein
MTISMLSFTLPPSLPESELSTLKVGFSGSFGTGNFSLCGTGYIKDGGSEYFIV